MTAREARPVWWGIVAFHLGLILLWVLTQGSNNGGVDEMGWLVAMNPLIALLAGVSVFGTEARARTHRFLAHHGVSPGWAWAIKTAIWAGALLIPVWGILAAYAVFMVTRPGFNDAQGVPLYAAVLINGFVIAQLCGMAIRRGITAGLVATVALLAVMVPLGGLHQIQMLPSWGLFTISPALLVVGWAWSRDWLLDRPGPGRLIRLSLLLATALGVLFGGYVVYRVGSVPDLRPELVQTLAVSVPSRDVSTTPNSAELYREAARRLTPVPPEALGLFNSPSSGVGRGVKTTGSPMTDEVGAWLRKNAEVLALVRRATALPQSQIVSIDGRTLFSEPEVMNFRGLALLIVGSHRERRERGDLDGAWEDLVVLLRMARHLNGPVVVGLAFEGLYVEQQALGLAMNWAVDSRQTSERLRASLSDYRQLKVPLAAASDSIRVEARLSEQTLNLPRAEFTERLLTKSSELRQADSTMAAWSKLVTTPWEMARARRAFPLLFAAKVNEAGFEPWQRGEPRPLNIGWVDFRAGSGSAAAAVSGDDLSLIEESTPLARLVFPRLNFLIDANERNEVARRALIQILALRSWQVHHGGRLPDRLAELVPTELPEGLPGDPYVNNAFRYIPSQGQRLLPLGGLDPLSSGHSPSELVSTTSHRLLYSIGPNRQDDGARENLTSPWTTSDIIFPLPESVPPGQ